LKKRGCAWPSLLPDTADILVCGLPLTLRSPRSRSAGDNRSACAWPPAPSSAAAVRDRALLSAPVSMGRSCQAHQPAGVPFAHLVLLHRVTRGCPKSRRLYQFFESTSFRARLSNVRSATTCFSFRFSSSSCFSFFASPLSIPPYFAFQR
jgi:hypothetical protein